MQIIVKGPNNKIFNSLQSNIRHGGDQLILQKAEHALQQLLTCTKKQKTKNKYPSSVHKDNL